MNKLKLDEKELVNDIINILKNKRVNFNKKKDVIRTYETINKSIISKGFSPYDINNLLNNQKSLKVSVFLKTLANEYNKILYKDLCKFNFKDNESLKDICNRSKIRGYKKIKTGIIDIAKDNINKWEGFWSFCDYKKGKINDIKFIDPDILKKLNL